MLSRSDFPAPEGPMMLTNSPSITSSSIPRSTSLMPDLSWKDFLIWRSRIIADQSVVRHQSSVLWFLEFSFVSKRDHRIDFCRPPRGDVTREKRDTSEQKGNRAEGHRIGWRYAKQQTRKEPRQPKRTRESCQDPDARKQHAASEHNSEQVGRLCSQRNTHSELPCPLCYRVRNDSVDADCGQDKSHTGEKGQKECQESRARLGSRHHVSHPTKGRQRRRGVEVVHDAANRIHRSRRITLGPDADVKGPLHPESLILHLIQRQIQFRARGLLESGVLDVSNNANHRAPWIPKVGSYPAPNGTLG